MIRYSRILILFTTQRSTTFSDWLKHTVRTLCLWNLTVYKKTSFNLYSIEMGQTKLLTKSPLFDNGYFYYYLNCIVHTQTCHGYGFRYSFLNFGDWNSIFPTIACLLKIQAHSLYVHIRRFYSAYNKFTQQISTTYHSHLALKLVRPWLLLHLPSLSPVYYVCKSLRWSPVYYVCKSLRWSPVYYVCKSLRWSPVYYVCKSRRFGFQ